jgi:hypothetical protein
MEYYVTRHHWREYDGDDSSHLQSRHRHDEELKSLIMMAKTLLSVDTTLRGDLKSRQENLIYMRVIQRGLQVQ